ncbi:efflux RND transporter periplasmic adaptor subunit [Spiribacter roseus]|uniref:efflux RND transporter periplasmic adaptor subunit n=1 Tax=Spiribacter roseus TaxID=1855875 RepID=UPI0011D072EA
MNAIPRIFGRLTVCLMMLPAVAWAQSDAAPVRLSAVEAGQQRDRIEAVGEARAARSVTLYPESTGIVTRLNVAAGERVEAGETLVELESAQARNALERASAELRDARNRLERYESGKGAGTFSPTTLENVRREVEIARLTREQAQLDLADRSRQAPFAGHLGLTDLEVGQRVDPDTPITTLDDRQTLRVRFRLAGHYHGQLAVGDRITLTAWARPESPVSATIQAIDSRIDRDTGTFQLEARLDNRDDRFRPGMRFRITRELAGPRHASIPATALQWGDNGAYVWRVEAGTAERVNVTLVARQADQVLVDGPLEIGDDVVSEGAQRMRPGIEVRIIDPATLDDYPRIDAVRDAPAQ